MINKDFVKEALILFDSWAVRVKQTILKFFRGIQRSQKLRILRNKVIIEECEEEKLESSAYVKKNNVLRYKLE